MKSSEKNLNVRNIFLSSWHPYFWLAAIPFLLYLQVLTFSEYTHHDDHYLIVESFSHIDKLSDIYPAFFEDASHSGQGGNLYRPLLTASLILGAQISGNEPFGYHLIDILLHCASCCLLFIVLQLLNCKRSVSFIGTLVFCIHPVLTQAVAWIPGMNDSLLSVFILSCFIAYVKFLSTSSLKWYIVHILFFALALFTKESTILFPLLALLYSFSMRREKIFSLTTISLLVGWGIILANWQIMRSAAHVAPLGDESRAAIRIVSDLWITFFYIGKVFWPFDLAFAPIPEDIHITAGIISSGLIFLAILLSQRRDWGCIFLGIAWFVAFLIPTFLVQSPPKFYEHRIYVPFIGIFFVLLPLSFPNKTRFFDRTLPFIVFIILCTFGWLSYIHMFDYKNSLTLHEYDAATSPNDQRSYSSITRMNIPKKIETEISNIHGSLQHPDSIYPEISKAEIWQILGRLNNELRSDYHNSELLHALAVVYYARGFYLKAEKNFLAALQGDTLNPDIPYNLGILYYDAHMGKKAEESWLEALRLEPDMGKGHLCLSFLYYESGQYKLAWQHCQKAEKSGIDVPPGLIKEIQRNIYQAK